MSSLLNNGALMRVMASHSPLSAKLAEEAGFDGVWASGFELSALYGLADVSLITMSQHLDMVRAMARVIDIPIIADIDTGYGNAVNVDYVVREYGRAGAAAVVMEDKTFPKVTSLLADARQDLARPEEFAGKIEAAKAAAQNGMLIIARTEALIAGAGHDEALLRARAYAKAGADLVMVHSKAKSAAEIEAFLDAWEADTRLVLAPTSYPELTEVRMAAFGKIGVVIYANHAIRAAVQAMKHVFAQIRADGGAQGVDSQIASVEEIFRLQDIERVRALETKFLR